MDFKPRLTLKTPFWLAESSFRRAAIGQTWIWCLYQSNSQNFFKFYCHFLGRRERGVFPVHLAFRKGFEVLPIGWKTGESGSLEGVRERGFKDGLKVLSKFWFKKRARAGAFFGTAEIDKEFWANYLKSRLQLNHVPVHRTQSAKIRNRERHLRRNRWSA